MPSKKTTARTESTYASIMLAVESATDAATLSALGERWEYVGGTIARKQVEDTVAQMVTLGSLAVAQTAIAKATPRADVTFAQIADHLSLKVGSDVTFHGWARASVSRAFDAFRRVVCVDGVPVVPADVTNAAKWVISLGQDTGTVSNNATDKPITKRSTVTNKAIVAAATKLAAARLEDTPSSLLPSVGTIRLASDKDIAAAIATLEGERERRERAAKGMTGFTVLSEVAPPENVAKMTKAQLLAMVTKLASEAS